MEEREFKRRLAQLVKDARHLPDESVLDALNEECEALRGYIMSQSRGIEDARSLPPYLPSLGRLVMCGLCCQVVKDGEQHFCDDPSKVTE